MEFKLLLIPLFTFIASLILIKMWMKVALKENILFKDMNKYKHPKVIGYAGIAVLTAFILGILLYVGVSVFYFQRAIHLIEIFAILSTLLIIGFIGIVDDLVGGWRKGLKQWQKPILTLPAALPLTAIKAGEALMILPIIGLVNLGLAYPLLLIPIGIVSASQGFNMLAGLNGLEAGNGIIIISTLGFIAWKTGQPWLALVALIMVAALLAFYLFNKYPAKVFPGDVLLYPLGALVASLAIIGNMERIAIILFLPYIAEFFIKAKNKMSTECFLAPNKDNTLEPPEKIGSLTHLIARIIKKIKGKVYENDIVLSIYLIELLLVAFVLII